MNTTADKKAGNKADKEVTNARRNKEFIPHSHNSDYVNVPTDTFDMKRKHTKEEKKGQTQQKGLNSECVKKSTPYN